MAWWRALVVLCALSATLSVMPAALAVPDDRFAYTDRFVYAADFSDARCLGFGCRPNFAYKAARRASEDDAAIVPYLLSRYPNARPTGKLYIALIVRIHDPDKGNALLKELSKLRGAHIAELSGCELTFLDLGPLADSFLYRPDFRFDKLPSL